ncbi:DUF4189 domain-containing protein [Shimia biformata]|uniref:DUF4189 domain-containing protein n=1 Tax=Shimia biformata TaxID=1294299 RepID=UPI00195158DD|nr:DUF4189 domain-containing protein [Shimia biformata]
MAGECGFDLCWGAVGVGPDGVYGRSYGHRLEAEALTVAQDGCGGNRTELRTFYNQCGAMARGTGGWGWAIESTRALAERNALNYGKDYVTNCRFAVWACSP